MCLALLMLAVDMTGLWIWMYVNPVVSFELSVRPRSRDLWF